MNPLIRAVDFIQDHNHTVSQFQRAAQDKTGLRHGAFRRVHQQNNPVDHLENSLDFPAKIRMPRRVDNVDFCVAVENRSVFGHDGNSALTLEIVRVHDAVNDLLIFAVNAGLLEHLIHERGLSVIDVRNDGNVS